MIEKLTENLNIHQNLPDNPPLSAQELKKEWDKPANTIKKYINDTLVSGVENEIDEKVSEKISAEMTSFKGEVNKQLEEFKENIDSFNDDLDKIQSTVTNQLNSIIKFQNFSGVFPVTGYNGLSKSLGNLNIPNGYYFLGLVSNGTNNENFVASFFLKGNTVYGNVHNLGTDATATVTCRAIFVKNNI